MAVYTNTLISLQENSISVKGHIATDQVSMPYDISSCR